MKFVLEQVTKKFFLQIDEHALKHVQTEHMREYLSLLSTFTQILRCATYCPSFFPFKRCFN